MTRVLMVVNAIFAAWNLWRTAQLAGAGDYAYAAVFFCLYLVSFTAVVVSLQTLCRR